MEDKGRCSRGVPCDRLGRLFIMFCDARQTVFGVERVLFCPHRCCLLLLVILCICILSITISNTSGVSVTS